MKGVKKGDNNNQFFCFFSIIFLKSFGFILVQHRLLSQFALFFGNFELPPVTTSLDFLKSPSLFISVYYSQEVPFMSAGQTKIALLLTVQPKISVFFFLLEFGYWRRTSETGRKKGNGTKLSVWIFRSEFYALSRLYGFFGVNGKHSLKQPSTHSYSTWRDIS